MPQKASINTEFLMRFCQRKVGKAKMFSNIIGVEESLVSYVALKLTKNIDRLFFFIIIFFFCTGACLHVTPACMRYKRRKNDTSPGLIVMFSNSCATPVAEETSRV